MIQTVKRKWFSPLAMAFTTAQSVVTTFAERASLAFELVRQSYQMRLAAHGKQRGDISDLALGIILIAIFIPVAFAIFLDVDTTNWDPAVAGLWDKVPLFAIVAIIVVLFAYVRKHKGGGSSAGF
jgi:hypothetical protein